VVHQPPDLAHVQPHHQGDLPANETGPGQPDGHALVVRETASVRVRRIARDRSSECCLSRDRGQPQPDVTRRPWIHHQCAERCDEGTGGYLGPAGRRQGDAIRESMVAIVELARRRDFSRPCPKKEFLIQDEVVPKDLP